MNGLKVGTALLVTVFITACVSFLKAEKTGKALFSFTTEDFLVDRTSVDQAGIFLSVEDELYVQLVLESDAQDRLSEILAAESNETLMVQVNDRVLLDAVSIHTETFPARVRIGVDSIEDAYMLLKALNRGG